MTSDPEPAVSYWHLWTDADGFSHQTRCTMTEFEKAAIQPQAAPQWIGAKTKDAGRLLGKIFIPYRVSNLTFGGGPAKNRLFIGGLSMLYSIFVNCRGVQAP